MTNEELKAAIKAMNNWCHPEPYEEDRRYSDDEITYLSALPLIEQAARELSQLKDGTHPSMVMVPRGLLEEVKENLVKFFEDHSTTVDTATTQKGDTLCLEQKY